MQFIDLKAQSSRIEVGILTRIKAVLAHGAYIMGPEVCELEAVLAERAGVAHAIGVSSGTDALLIALMALGIGAGDEVITTPFSFYATAEVIALLGAKPVFVDINRDTYNIDVMQLEAAITGKTKAIMPVSMYGQCADYDAINVIAARYQLPVIEDGAQSFGATHHGKPSCGLTTIGCTSFFPSKPLGAYGDAGACFTNDAALAERMASIRVHGQAKRYEHIRLGINGRLDTIQAAILLEKLTLFSDEIVARQAVAARYTAGLSSFVKTPSIQSYNTSVFAQYTVEVSDREAVQAALKAQDIPTAVHYPMALHEQPVFKQLDSNVQSFPNAEAASRVVLSLPMHPYLTEAHQNRVIGALQEVLQKETNNA
ncbi:MAG: DegT/DnrJ/EryC1/StrS family aminotransferase [Gammaproteobacteria bacterium]|nr:DegT/DnrJ/EryC1/StrS family aminotransferase [Gammaproteobacteria bacterium]MCH9763997.1 DegT/DnrJ/EryC1/StrS family aminotransferase [Gammaproteobacteria bacterium]